MAVTKVQLISNVSTGASFAGIVTATSFIGNGSALSGIVTTRNLTISTRGGLSTISVVGTGLTLSLRTGIGTLNF